MKNIYIVDLNKDKSKKNNYLSETLITKMQESFKNGKKTILYINKRGAYNMLVCKDCSNIQKCPACDIILSVHKNPEKLICHHCSYSQEVPIACEKCGSIDLEKVGVGTQQIEENIKKFFPGETIFRMGSDNVKNIGEKKLALENLKNSKIIVGTKMITTGFDFRDIGVIGIILLEQELQIPKYDTEEKIYSNITQLIGRGGRVGSETDVIIQTFAPNNEMIKNIINLNYKDFLKKTLEERKIFNYPPFCELVTLRYKNIDSGNALDFMTDLKQKLDKYNNGEYEIIRNVNTFKRNNQYFAQIIIKGNNVRKILENIKKEIFSEKDLAVIF